MKKLIYLLAVFCFCSSLVFADSTFVSGTIVSQTWSQSNSPYCVEDNIFIAGLVIEPGVKVIFLGEYQFEVGGILTAVGTKQDSIYFTKSQNSTGWNGIFFNYSSPGSELAYCRIDSSINSGIRIENSNPYIRNCVIVNNQTTNFGGGLVSNSTLTLDSCKISNNYCTGQFGGGIYNTGTLILKNCEVSANYLYWHGSSAASYGGGIYSLGTLKIIDSKILNNRVNSYDAGAFRSCTAYGGGVFQDSDSLYILNSYICSNIAEAHANTAAEVNFGGGLFLTNTWTKILNSVIAHNYLFWRGVWGGSDVGGGGIWVNIGTNLEVINSTIAYNDYHGIRQSSGNTTVLNTIIWENSDSQIEGNINATYCDIQDGYSGNGNINVNPLFLNDIEFLIAPGSLCIDAGDSSAIYNDLENPGYPGYPLFPSLGTLRNDIGAYGGPHADRTMTLIEEPVPNIPDQNYLSQNYPNPFNPLTTINYSIVSPGLVSLRIYDILGREITTLVNMYQPAGQHRVDFNAAGLASGTYFYRIWVGLQYSQIRKMVVIR